MIRTPRVLVAILIVLGLTSGPVLGAALSVTSSSLTTFRTCTLTPLTALSNVGTDSTVDEASPTTALGTSTSLTVTSRSSSRNARVYLRFDLTRCNPAIPSSAIINAANLRMVPMAVATACRTYDVFRVTASWSETTITWNNQPFGTTLNNPPTASRTTSNAVGAAPCTNTSTNVYTSRWNVTSDVATFVAGTQTNFGWMIRDDAESESSTARTTSFYSRDIGSIASAQLIVDYAT
jgi:hypothetical protein